MNKPIIYTVGHSTHQSDYFLELLQAYSINCLIDVRSVAASSYNRQYNKEPLSNFLKNNGIIYLHFAEEFGARHTDPELVSTEAIASLTYSLSFISTDQFEVTEKVYQDNPKTQKRLAFSYNGNHYELSVIDPEFLQQHLYNPDLLKNVKLICLCLSLGILHNDWHYKLVAGIFFKKNHNIFLPTTG